MKNIKTDFNYKKHYYKIAELHKPEGLFELWESKHYGDEVVALVTLNGNITGSTWDDLYIWYDEEFNA